MSADEATTAGSNAQVMNGNATATPTPTPSNATSTPTASPSNSTKAAEPAPAQPSDECRGMSEAAHEKIRAFLERQRAAVESLLARHESEHQAFHEKNASEADEKAFHERHAHEWTALKDRQGPELDHYTAESWHAYREACERNDQARPATSAPRELPAECRERWAELERFSGDVGRKWDARHKEFQIHFDAARAEFRKSEHSDADWKAFEEKWSAEARNLFQSMEVDMRDAADKAGLLRCWAVFHEKANKPVPSYADKPKAREPSGDDGARRIMERCQVLMEKLQAEFGAQSESTARRGDYQTYRDGTTADRTKPAPSPYAEEGRPSAHVMPTSRDGAEIRERLMKLKAQCEAEMNAYLEKKHAEREGFGSFVMREEDGKILVQGKYLSMVGLPERQMMTEIAINKKVLIDALFANGYLAEFRPEQTEQGSAIMVFDASGHQVLGVHDNPRGVIKLSTTSEIESLTLDLNDNLELVQDKEGIRFAYGDWKGALLVHKGSVEIGEGNVLTIHGKATFLVTNAFREKANLGEKYDDAVLQKKVGAEVTVAKDGSSEATPLTDLEVKDTKLVGAKLSARIDAPDGEGKTVVFKVATGLFKCDGLGVKLFAVNEDGTESSLEIREASDLEDVLDPADDGPDGFEYWCVSDKDGQQILVSIAHFSEKRVEVESLGATGLPVIPGFDVALLAAAAGVAAIVVGMRRRL